MKQTPVEWMVSEMLKPNLIMEEIINQAKEMEEKYLLEMLQKFGFDYTYNYRGEKTIHEWIPEWFEEYKRLESFKK